ncbi:helix-turn-helix transcriptional regulator [Shinella curvata]|uniref:Helix-turn-helix transcriptional regulator n=1 Tax=Shinella curvata TaxID=1817964 RepID=A0ABT8XLA2_9HYPH|nr:helix-turn-helix transcriptional regulator [Shinella curvata]MCJ8056688.1 helix-turn-helix transcriptional regulator [Shinella curvata]MDO6124472.1 helix-turn-helix transcriptional regulator [Shinella curvata]
MIADIYEAAMLPEYWPSALTRLCTTIGVEACTLVTVDDAMPRWTCSNGFTDKMQTYIDGGWHDKNKPLERLLQLGRTGFIRDIDLFSPDEIEELSIVRDLKRPAGLGWSAAMATPMPGGEMLLFSIEQLWKRGPIDDRIMATLEGLRPHISRAALLAAKLRHQQAVGAVESLDLANVPAAIVGYGGNVIAANHRFCLFETQISIGPRERLCITHPDADNLLREALFRLAWDQAEIGTMSIPIPAVLEDEKPLIVHIVPTRGQARDLLGPMTVLVIVTQMGTGEVVKASLLRALFDLSPAESRVCEAILSGFSKSALQAALKISGETEKSHVKSILQKTGLRSRIELVRFMSGLRLTDG